MDTNPSPETPRKSDNTLVHQRTWTDYLWIIREHWILALVFAVSISTFFAYKKLQEIPLYRSTAILLFEPDTDRIIPIQSVVDSGGGRAADFVIRNHLTDLRSNSFRDRVVESFTDEEKSLLTKDYVTEENPEPSVHGIIAGANKIALVGVNIFKFEFQHRNPEAAALLANRFSDEFVAFVLDRGRKANEQALRFLRSQSEELKLKVERSELEVQQYRQERNLVSLEESQNLIVERMKNLSGALNSAKVNLLSLKASLEQITAAGEDFEQLAALPAINTMGNLPRNLQQRTELLRSEEAHV